MDIRIRDIIDSLMASTVSKDSTVDKLEYGNPDSIVKGVIVTFLATQEVVEKARDLGANLIITHEGIFYSHWDKQEILSSAQVYLQKRKTIEDCNMAIFRFHDCIHRHMPDGITRGLLQSLNWQNYEVKNLPAASILEIPETCLQETVLYIKKTLAIRYVRCIGDPSMTCKRVGLLVGYRGGGESVLPLFEKENLDMVIYGEGPEWETPEYVRDAMRQGRKKALIVLGHAESEIPGMEYLAKELQERFQDVPVHFMPQKPVFEII